MVESPTVRPKGGDTGGQGRDTVGLVGLKKKGRISNRVLTEPEPFAMVTSLSGTLAWGVLGIVGALITGSKCTRCSLLESLLECSYYNANLHSDLS